MPESLARVRIVLVRTSHPGNIGAAARAMKTMGLRRLVLVSPRSFPHAEASALAAGADDVLARAHVVGTLTEAIADCRLAYGCTARPRGVALTEHAPRAAAALLVAPGAGEVALVFGNERAGLSNDELQQCHAAVHIPSDAEYGSLNLAAAVQVLAYELRLAALAAGGASTPEASPEREAGERDATAQELEGFFGHLERALAAIDFFKGRSPATIMRRLRRLYFRAALSEREVLILRGILADAERMARLAGRCEAGGSGNSRSGPGAPSAPDGADCNGR